MVAKDYIDRVIKDVETKHSNKPEFIQVVSQNLQMLEPYLKLHPEVEEYQLLNLLVEPERIIQFRVPWQTDEGDWRVNLGWRVQYNSALGPYKGGLRFHPHVNESVLRFLGFEQMFKNALTDMPIGGAKGGSDFNPENKSDSEIMRFCQSFMTELQKYIGPNLDIPAGDIGVGHREIGYMYGQYKRLNQFDPGVITGKKINQWGSFIREEATGYGLIYFADEMLKNKGIPLSGKRVVISGAGTVGTYALKKLADMGAEVIAISDASGYIIDENTGINFKVIETLYRSRRPLSDYQLYEIAATYVPGESVWNIDIPFDYAFPCATQNEINEEMAQNMVHKCRVKGVFEGANMPLNSKAIDTIQENGILYAPGKAANAGGVCVSALEMAQNAQREQWEFDVVDEKLRSTMTNIYLSCRNTANEYLKDPDNIRAGADILGFKKLSEAMIEQGLV